MRLENKGWTCLGEFLPKCEAARSTCGVTEQTKQARGVHQVQHTTVKAESRLTGEEESFPEQCEIIVGERSGVYSQPWYRKAAQVGMGEE